MRPCSAVEDHVAFGPGVYRIGVLPNKHTYLDGRQSHLAEHSIRTNRDGLLAIGSQADWNAERAARSGGPFDPVSTSDLKHVAVEECYQFGGHILL